MSVYSAEYHAMVMSPGPAGGESVTVTANKAAGQGETGNGSADKGESFFHHLLDVVNPLQHLPVIGTIYRAITGEHIGSVEKIAGDTLYGGMWGAISSVADVAFEGITGKNFEDTVLSLFKGDDKMRVASARVAAPSIIADSSLPSSDLPALPSSDLVAANSPGGMDVALTSAALSNSLSAKGVDGETASRALYAYRRSLGFSMPQPVLASVH
jgi:hypothetical protein